MRSEQVPPSNCRRPDRCQNALEKHGFLPLKCANLGELGGCAYAKNDNEETHED